MISFTIEEAIANLENPFKPKFLKKDEKLPETSEAISQGITKPENLANSFTEESWKEFVEKYGFHYFSEHCFEVLSTVDQIFVNYENCVIIMFEPQNMEIASFYWTDSKGTAHSCYFHKEDLSEFYDNFYHAVFPKKADATILALSEEVYEQHHLQLFPRSEQVAENVNWEEVRELMMNLETEENSTFMQKVIKLIDNELEKLSKKCKYFSAKEGELVFRKNIVGDGSYGSEVLRIALVSDVYVTYENFEASLMKTTRSTFKGDFWNNFEHLDVILPDLLALVLNIFKNVLDMDIVNSILVGKLWEGEATFTRYGISSDYACFDSNHFKIVCGLGISDHFYINVSLKKHTKDRIEEVDKNSTYAEGFYTDVLLAYALGYTKDCYMRFDYLKQIVRSIQETLSKNQLLTDAIEQVLADALANVNKVLEYVITKAEKTPKNELPAGVVEQKSEMASIGTKSVEQESKSKFTGTREISLFPWE